MRVHYESKQKFFKQQEQKLLLLCPQSIINNILKKHPVSKHHLPSPFQKPQQNTESLISQHSES